MKHLLSFRSSLTAKVLLTTSAVITVLVGVTGWFVQRYAVQSTSQVLRDEVRTSLRAYESLWHARADMLASISLVMSNMSDVRAAFSTGDRATIRDTAGELWQQVSHDDAIFLVTDPQGGLVASLAGQTRIPNLDIVKLAAAKFPKQAAGFLQDGNLLFQVVITPVYVQSEHGPALLNVLLAGYPVTTELANTLKDSTGSDFVFFANNQPVVSTLDESTTRAIAHGSTEYAVSPAPLISVDGQQIGELRIARSFQRVRQHLVTLQRNLVTIWVLAILIGLLLSYALTRRVVGPIVRLNEATAEVARQNYDSRVPVESEDELGSLASSFNGMCASLQHARQELIRQERLGTIGHLSTSIVHDLRNPLAAIYGGSEMLVDGDLTPAQTKRLSNNIYRASRRMQELLQELLDVSRGSAESPEVCSLRDLVHAACEPLQAAAQSQGVEISIGIPDNLDVAVERARIERVFFNLFTNAIEALDGGGKISAFGEKQQDCAVVRISDNGPGIPRQVRSRLFEPFVTAGKKNGLGLGLALSRQTVVAHGGELWAEEVTSGALFCVSLPIAS